MNNWIEVDDVDEIPKNIWILIKLNFCGTNRVTVARFDKELELSIIGNIGGCF